MKKLVAIVALALSLSACSAGSKEHVCTFEDQSRGLKSKLVHTHSGDVVKGFKETIVFSYEQYGISEEHKEAFQQQIKETFNPLYGETNVTYQDEKDTLTVIVSIVYDKETIKKLQESGVVTAGNISHISLKESIKELEASGYNCGK